MSTIAMFNLLVVVAVFGAIYYWIFIAPVRARKRRLAEVSGRVGHYQSWDPGIGAKKRDR